MSIQAEPGGACVVRIRHCLSAESDHWDKLTATLPLTGTLEPIDTHRRVLRTQAMLAHFFAVQMGRQTLTCLHIYNFSKPPINQLDWQQWLQQQL